MGQDEYVEVYAQSTFARDAGNPSGGEETTFAHVSWTRENGFSGVDWFTGSYQVYDSITGDPIIVTGPTFGMDSTSIQNIIDQDGNLNNLFDTWEASATLAQRSGWIAYVASQATGCVSE